MVEQPQLKPEWDGAQPDKVIPLLQTVSDLLEKRCDRFLSNKYNLTTPQYMLLLAAMNEHDTTLGGLSDFLNCSRGNVTGIVDRLERDGWLVRERSTEDRRVITVRLTDKGTRVFEIKKELTKELNELAGVWNPDERKAMVEILIRLYKELKD